MLGTILSKYQKYLFCCYGDELFSSMYFSVLLFFFFFFLRSPLHTQVMSRSQQWLSLKKSPIEVAMFGICEGFWEPKVPFGWKKIETRPPFETFGFPCLQMTACNIYTPVYPMCTLGFVVPSPYTSAKELWQPHKTKPRQNDVERRRASKMYIILESPPIPTLFPRYAMSKPYHRASKDHQPSRQASIKKKRWADEGTRHGGNKRGRGGHIRGRLGLRMGRDVHDEKAWGMAISCLLDHEAEGGEPWPPWPRPPPLNHQQKCATSFQKEATISVCSGPEGKSPVTVESSSTLKAPSVRPSKLYNLLSTKNAVPQGWKNFTLASSFERFSPTPLQKAGTRKIPYVVILRPCV